jgi:hypothetical protein
MKPRSSTANLGFISGPAGQKIRVQFKDGVLCFKPHRSRAKPERLTLRDAYDSARKF